MANIEVVRVYGGGKMYTATVNGVFNSRISGNTPEEAIKSAKAFLYEKKAKRC